MCGICGIVSGKTIDSELIRKMTSALSHRGPDDEGIYLDGKLQGTSNRLQVGLGHRRLSILDLSPAGYQPMSDEKGEIWITFNGEIYNFKDIRTQLESKGHKFKSQSDTEVIINAYKEWGTDCLHLFNGMFAFGIYDSRKNIIFLARDRVGKKPLYYAKYNGIFSFASEIKSLIQEPSFPKYIDFIALNAYFAFGYIPQDLCIFKHVRKLPPASALTYDLSRKEIKIWKYWNVPDQVNNKIPEEQLLDELEHLFEDSVRLRMISDVPLGAFLSGGIDSSLVVAMMSRLSKQPVKTFSIGFEEAKYNELKYARIVAKHFKTEHHELIVKPDAFGILPELVRQYDEPFADSSMIPTYYVSKATRDYVKVALSGDGGDELFGGYQWYWTLPTLKLINQFIPSTFRKLFGSIGYLLPSDARARRALMLFKDDILNAHITTLTQPYFKSSKRREFLSASILKKLKSDFNYPEQLITDLFNNGNYDFINKLTYTDFMSYLPDDIMAKVDRASMKVALETRAPFLDYRIAEFSFSKLPGNMKVKGLTKKYLLKKLARKLLPKELDLNRKMGFGIPVSEWFRGELYPTIKDILLSQKSPYFNQEYVARLLKEHKKGIEHSSRLYAILVFTMWAKEYGIK